MTDADTSSPRDATPGLWWRAVALASRVHQGDTRKDGRTPYVAHPVRVALWVRHEFGFDDEAALAAALLHDTIEDTGADYDDVAQTCGRDVADMVAALSKNMLLPEDERETDYDRRLARADWRARLIKLADVLDNLIDKRPDADMQKLANRCRRALALAANDETEHEAVRRGAALVRAAMAESGL